MTEHLTFLGIITIASAAVAALFLLHHLLVRPALTTATKVRLLLGLGVFPLMTAAANTAEGMRVTTTREFCGGCHVMQAHLHDVEDGESASLASRHGRNHHVGENACYVCHENYGLLGYPLTKLTGMKHMYMYYFEGYSKMKLEDAVAEIRMVKPYPNSNCMQCHSGKLESWRSVKEHAAMLSDLDANRVACASAGCHGFSHPFSKPPEEGGTGRSKHEEHAER